MLFQPISESLGGGSGKKGSLVATPEGTLKEQCQQWERGPFGVKEELAAKRVALLPGQGECSTKRTQCGGRR